LSDYINAKNKNAVIIVDLTTSFTLQFRLLINQYKWSSLSLLEI